MNKNKIYLGIFLIVMMLMPIFNVNAFSDSIGPIKQSGEEVKTNGWQIMALKYYDTSTAVFCTKFEKNSPAGRNLSCQKINNWDEKTSVAIASIIKSVGNVPVEYNANGIAITNAPANYYYGELAINYFLYNMGIDNVNTGGFGRKAVEEVLKDYSYLYTNAVSAYNNHVGTVSISFSTNELTFTKQGNNYISNKVTVTSNMTDYDISSNIGTVTEEGNTFYVTVPANSFTSTTNVTVTGNLSKSFDVAQEYDCGIYQSITPNYVETKTVNASASASGTISTTTLTINKVDSNGNFLPGAIIRVENNDKTYSKEFTTESTSLVINDLPYGEYTVTEISAPNKYVNSKTTKKITLSDTKLSETVEIKNELTRVSIRKISIVDSEPLSGVVLQIQDKEGNKIAEFTTTEKEYVIEGLEYGEYYIVEISAPEGYAISKDKTKFIVNETSDNLQITVRNGLTEVEITKLSAVNNKELPGATLKILDSDGNDISCKIISSDGKIENLKECSWVSTDTATTIVGLEAGKYKLREIIAPEGYVLSEKEVEFEVKGDGTTTKVEMLNELEVEVPDTLSSKSALLVTIAMFDIALGIGIVTYVKKNKVAE